MALRERVKRKHIESAIKVLPADGARPIDYALGGGGSMSPRMLVLALVGGWVVVTVLLSVALHTLVVIGAIPLVIVSFALNQPRGVLLSDRGVALLRRSFLTSRPEAVVGLDSSASLGRAVKQQAGYTRIQVGPGQVWVKDSDLTRLRQQSGG
ncbi:MAG: hypothetical protein QOF20_1648 [Acidimicrobiaceae bacterium]|nr:hypothetical protein [Acidimicrobiaceae bacterium]MDQ1399066.1 hypothetical protein [Acidimicrobiaceae bacterium]MDQ1413405.1 hypothetical protein [Acidimicrobiaceae bacterium]